MMNNNNSNTWLLTYNPSKWDWEEYDEGIAKTKSGTGFLTNWNCTNLHAKIGDRVFLIKLGDNSTPKGIIATGYITSDFWEAEHYDNQKNIRLKYVDIILTTLLDYKTDNIITLDELNQKFPEQKWSSQCSGIAIKPDAAQWLIKNIDNYVKHSNIDDNSPDYNEPVIWKISHGTSRTGIPEHLRQVFEDRKVVVVNQGTMRLAVQKTPQGEAYMKEIKKGDYFFLCYSGEIVLLGQFTEDNPKLNQEMVQEWNDYDWYERTYRLIAHSNGHNKYTGKKKIWTSNYNSTCVKVNDNTLFEELILEPYFGLKMSDLKTVEYNEPYTKTNFLNEVFITEQQYTTLAELLNYKKNIILQGAPGVGKTFTAKRLAYSIMGEKDESRIEFIQFHQSYSYEDFIMGYRPTDNGGFELKEGVFYRFCKNASRDPYRKYFFIIDEINRGNLSKIFGELLMLIEKDYRGESAALAYKDEQFSVPDNLYIIGMMNTADRSLAMIDYALRRRFVFFPMTPAFEKAADNGFMSYKNNIRCKLYHKVIDRIMELNRKIRDDGSLGKGYEIGHSYFIPDLSPEKSNDIIDDDWVKRVVRYEIAPLIKEYWFDDDKTADDELKNLYNAIGEEYDD